MSSTIRHPLMVVRKNDHPIGSMQGYCWTTFTELLARLGPPHIERGDKTTVEWHYECRDGTCFHVYDWKQSATPAEPYWWLIGGTSLKALDAFSRHTGLPSSVSQKLYTVGWRTLTPDELAEIPPDYRAEAQGITTFGKGVRCFFSTPGEAQWFLDQIVQNNSSANLRTLTPLGADGLFIVQREDAPGDPWPHVRFSRYTPPGGAHIIPTPPSVLGNRP